MLIAEFFGASDGFAQHPSHVAAGGSIPPSSTTWQDYKRGLSRPLLFSVVQQHPSHFYYTLFLFLLKTLLRPMAFFVLFAAATGAEVVAALVASIEVAGV